MRSGTKIPNRNNLDFLKKHPHWPQKNYLISQDEKAVTKTRLEWR